MPKLSEGREANYHACLLLHGDIPVLPGERYEYKERVMSWWRDACNDPNMTDKACHRFYNRFRHWAAHMRYGVRHV